MKSSQLNKRARSQRAHTLAEFGPTLLLASCLILLPMLAFGTVGMRYIFLLNAARLAVQQAARCKAFLADPSATELSSVHAAKAIATQSVANIGGGMITLTSAQTFIKVCPVGGSRSSVSTPGADTPLSVAADPQKNIYNCEIVLQGVVQPMFPGARSMLGGISGFNSPINTSVRMDCFFENTTNLNI